MRAAALALALLLTAPAAGLRQGRQQEGLWRQARVLQQAEQRAEAHAAA